ncbi:MAG: Gmad2 immunoglobulin-like domain-containing protein [Cyclobacteriaceae bacterium]
MKLIYLLIAVALSSCNEKVKNTKASSISDSVEGKIDSIHKANGENQNNLPLPIESFANTRFKDVTVEKSGANTYTIQGKGQIFEANFSWIVEDGHEELEKGYQMTDAGAPEWGKFKFTIEVQKRRPNSTLTLILFESSAKDGSRQYELPIVLE